MSADQLRAEQRKRYLRNLIREGIINVLAEQQPIVPTSAVPPAAPGIAPETNGSEDMAPPPPEEQPPQDVAFTPESMVEKLNVLRGGKSFTDPEVFGRLTEFFNTLSDEQKSGLDQTLTALGKAVMGATAEDAGLEDPTQAPQQQQNQGMPTVPPPTQQGNTALPSPVAPTM